MQILGLLGMYFDAVVVEVEKYLLFFQVGSGHTVIAAWILFKETVSGKLHKVFTHTVSLQRLIAERPKLLTNINFF